MTKNTKKALDLAKEALFLIRGSDPAYNSKTTYRVVNHERFGELLREFFDTEQKLNIASVSGKHLPSFLYEDGHNIRVGVHGDTNVTDEWQAWLNACASGAVDKTVSDGSLAKCTCSDLYEKYRCIKPCDLDKSVQH